MKPVVVAWALLFVVAVGVLYRFGSWIGRRRRRSPRHSTKAEELDETPPDPKTTEAPPVVGARASVTAVAPTRPATSSIAAAQARVASAPEVRQPTATSTAAAKPPPLPPVTSKVAANVRPSTNHATTAPAKVLRPSVSATLQPPEVRQAGCWKRGGYDVTEVWSGGSCSARGALPKLRKFGQTFRRQCRPVRSRVRLQQTSRRPQSPNRRSTHRKQTCSKRV